jgi:hypothetical protein
MVNLSNQYRILYFLYVNFHEDRTINLDDLKNKDDLVWMSTMIFQSELNYLIGLGYVDNNSTSLQLTAKGVNIIEILVKKFVTYAKSFHTEELDHWIKIFNFYKDNNFELVKQVHFFVRMERMVEKAFKKYLSDIDDIHNIQDFEISNNKLEIIDEIFLNLNEVNILVENRFKFKLFYPPLSSQSTINKAIKAKPINFTDLVATVGAIIDGISIPNHSIPNKDKLLLSKKTGSINKFKTFLDIKELEYDNNTIVKLKALHAIRSKTFPIHNSGAEVIPYLNNLTIGFPIDDYKNATYKILDNFNICLLEIKKWFLTNQIKSFK